MSDVVHQATTKDNAHILQYHLHYLKQIQLPQSVAASTRPMSVAHTLHEVIVYNASTTTPRPQIRVHKTRSTRAHTHQNDGCRGTSFFYVWHWLHDCPNPLHGHEFASSPLTDGIHSLDWCMLTLAWGSCAEMSRIVRIRVCCMHFTQNVVHMPR